jgi:hypothetical protein
MRRRRHAHPSVAPLSPTVMGPTPRGHRQRTSAAKVLSCVLREVPTLHNAGPLCPVFLLQDVNEFDFPIRDGG